MDHHLVKPADINALLELIAKRRRPDGHEQAAARRGDGHG
jgi:hypothetical protein